MRHFLIKKICPFAAGGIWRKKILALLPLKVTLIRKPPDPSNYYRCQEKKYVISNAAGNKIRARIGLPSDIVGRDFVVCEHMGHILKPGSNRFPRSKQNRADADRHSKQTKKRISQ